ncbi:MAG: hypothetical protein M1814_002699 [Vezdaea aestivalis]|nr:MAG: hypothetical protein M1814_002699 [Vezdaea aestivalis]
MSEINIAILGAQGVGKSTFIQRSFGLRETPAGNYYALKLKISGSPYTVRLFEVNLDYVHTANDGSVQWPIELDEVVVPHMDGVLAMYDVTERDSLNTIPNVLDGLINGRISTVLVASKCDLPGSAREVNPDLIEQNPNVLGRIECFKTSAVDPESQKAAIFSLMRRVGQLKHSSSQTEKPSRSRRQSSQTRRSSHGQATSPITVPVFMSSSHLDQKSPSTTRTSRSNGSRPPNGRSLSEKSFHSKLEPAPLHPSRTSDWVEPSDIKSAGLGLEVVTDIPFRNGKVVDTFLNMEDEPEDTHPEDDDGETPLLDRKDNESITEQPTKVSGYAFEDLVDRLLSQPMSKSDHNFASIFFCLYRKFAAPADLLDSMLHRFDNLEGHESSYMTKISSQLRLVASLVTWTTDYPGDFAHPYTKSQLAHFVTKLSANRVFAISARDIRINLELGAEDEDGIWGYADTGRPEYRDDSFLSAASSIRSSTATLSAINGAGDLERQTTGNSNGTDDGDTLYHSSLTSTASRSTGSNTTASATPIQTAQTIPSNLAAAEKLAQSLVPSSRYQLSKTQWHAFIDNSDEDIATELTRIDWTMFCAIRPRDLIRHVSLPSEKKDHLKSVENVNRMINHFNHVAYWVANMIILRDKPKHRAIALEKFMNVAWKLRYRNNYNSLGAVIAGINGSAVHRLTQTRELVDHKVQKNFMRLEILMGTQRSHFAYRLAWENTPSERIPFLPLHRRDLVSAEQGNRTFLGDSKDRINWKKFEVMGDVIVGLQKSRSIPYTDLALNAEVKRVVLECAFIKDDDALYERSVQLEVPGTGASDPSRKKFPWFQR